MLVDVGGSLALSTYGYGTKTLGVTMDLSTSIIEAAKAMDTLEMVRFIVLC